ncbi:hypothetical protein [Streptomyces sp. NPDC015131]|uniref:hypothetical protein n=1 Tax=Streptomyces sp. NPDC015131 TaxID=3364941 RepID=UPI0036FB3E20
MIAARKICLPKQSARPLAQLRARWKVSAILTSAVAADIGNSAAVIRTRVAAMVDIPLAAVDVTLIVIAMLRPKPNMARLTIDPPHVRAAVQAAVEGPYGIGTFASSWAEVSLPATGTWNPGGSGGPRAR